MPSLGPAEILVVLVIALLVFGPNKMPEIARQVGKGFREFRRVQQHLKSELRDVVSEFDSPSSTPAVEPDPLPDAPAEGRRRADAASARYRRPTTPARPTPTPGRLRPQPTPPGSNGGRRRPLSRTRPGADRLTRPVPFRKQSDPEGRMTVFEHLGELRRRLMISIVAVVVAGTVVFIFAPEIISFLVDVLQGRHRGHARTRSSSPGPLDAFATRLKVATYGGIVLALPVWLWQLWRFITPGLNPKEKRYAIPFIARRRSCCSSWAGVVALLTLEPALDFLLNIGGADLQPLLTADKYVTLVSLMIVAFGLSFEFPVMLVFLLLARVLTTQQLRKWRRYAAVDHRGLRGGHHPEPGPVLAVRHGGAHVHVLRGVDPDRKDVEAMSPQRKGSTRGHARWKPPPRRREVVDRGPRRRGGDRGRPRRWCGSCARTATSGSSTHRRHGRATPTTRRRATTTHHADPTADHRRPHAPRRPSTSTP